MKYLWKIINRPFQLVWWCLLKSSSQMAENRIPVITDQGTPDTSISTSLRIKGLSYSRSSLEEAFLEDSFLVCPFLAGSPSRGKKHRSLLHRKRFVHRERKKEREIRRGERDRERESERIITMTLAKSMWRTFYTKRRDKMKILKVIEVNKNFVLWWNDWKRTSAILSPQTHSNEGPLFRTVKFLCEWSTKRLNGFIGEFNKRKDDWPFLCLRVWKNEQINAWYVSFRNHTD